MPDLVLRRQAKPSWPHAPAMPLARFLAIAGREQSEIEAAI